MKRCKAATFLTLFLLALPAAEAGLNKCTKPDGSVLYQAEPCPNGAPATRVTSQPLMGSPAGTPRPQTGRSIDSLKSPRAAEQERAEEQAQQEAEKIKAHNRQVLCARARRNLAVLREQVPVFTYNEKGEKVYVENDDRPARIAEAERAVSDVCN